MKKFIDIGANLTDPMFQGIYGGSHKHAVDLKNVIERAFNHGMQKIILTGGSLSESLKCIQYSRNDERLFATVGCHPTRCNEFAKNPDQYCKELEELIEENRDKVVAVGECGLDYDREHFCKRDVQKIYFAWQLRLCQRVKLPLFLHCRAAFPDFIEIIQRELHLSEDDVPDGEGEGASGSSPPRLGVVHTFDGSLEEGRQLLRLGFHLGVNGCSLKTEEQLNVVSQLPLQRLLLETDAPWCEIRPSHAGHKFVKFSLDSRRKEKWEAGCLVKSRNEPVNIVQVLEVLAGIRTESEEDIANATYHNTLQLFFPDEINLS